MKRVLGAALVFLLALPMLMAAMPMPTMKPAYATGVTAPSGVVEYVAINFTNSMGSSIVGGTQVQVFVNWATYSTYLDNPVDNYVFFNSSGNLLYSWLENGTANTSANSVIWLVTDAAGIGASANVTYYLGFYGLNTNVLSATGYTGEAPQLSGTYAQYDNGAYVFPYYQAWGGLSTLPTNWANYYSTLTFASNYTKIAPTSSATYTGIYLSSLPSSMTTFPTVIESYGNYYNTNGAGVGSTFQMLRSATSNNAGTPGYGLDTISGNLAVYFQSSGSNYITGYSDTNVNKIYSMVLPNKTAGQFLVNYTSQWSWTSVPDGSANDLYLIFNGCYYSGTYTTPQYIYWLRTRTYVAAMPSTSFGSLQAGAPSYTLTVNSPTGGTVNATTGAYGNGTIVGLLATALSQYTFANWQIDGVNSTANPTSVTMTANHTVSAFFSALPLDTAWFSSSWQYRIQHNVTVQSTITAMQASITVINGTGVDSGNTLYLNNLTKPDFSDIRVVDGYSGSLLPIWNSTSFPGANCTIFYRDDFSAGINNTVYVYYGNLAAAVAWDGAAVWQYFQNFTYSGMAFPVNYTKFAGNPILTSSTNSLRDAGLLYSNGWWYLVYSNWTTQYGAAGSLWMANSSDFQNWNIMGQVVTPSGWEGQRLDAPTIQKVGSTFYIFFTGSVYEGTLDADGTGQIGYASTTDITNATSWVQGATGAPLVASALGTYKGGVMDPELVINGSTAYLFYCGYYTTSATANMRNQSLSVATTPIADFPNGPWTDSPSNPLVIVPWLYDSTYNDFWGSEGWNMVYDAASNEYFATFTAWSPADSQAQVFSGWSTDLYHWNIVTGADLTRTQSWEYATDEIGGSAWKLVNGTLYGVYSGTNSYGLHALGLFTATLGTVIVSSLPLGNTLYTTAEAQWCVTAGVLQFNQVSPTGSTGDDLNASADQGVTWTTAQFSYPVKIVTNAQLASWAGFGTGMGLWLGSNGQNYVLGEMKAGTGGGSTMNESVLMNVTSGAWTSWLGNVTFTPNAGWHLEELDYNGSNIAYMVDGSPIANTSVPYSTVKGGLRDRVWDSSSSATMNDQYVYVGKLATLTDGSYGTQETYSGGVTTVPVTIDTSPSGMPAALTIDGVAYTGPQTFTWTSGSFHTISAASSFNDWIFSSWSDGGAQTHTVAPTSSTAYTASYIEQNPPGPPYQPPSTTQTVPPIQNSNQTVVVTVGGTTTIMLPILPPGNQTGWIVANVTTGNTPPYIGIEFNGTLPSKPIPSSGTSVGVTVSAGGGAIPGAYQIPVTTTFQDAYNRTVTTKSWLNIDVEALGAVPWANWFAWFLIGIFALMLLEATQTKKKP